MSTLPPNPREHSGTPSPRPRRRQRWLQVFVVCAFFLLGYNSMTARTQTCGAQYTVFTPIPGLPITIVTPSPCGCAGVNTVPCTMIGSTAAAAAIMQPPFYEALIVASQLIENYIAMAVDSLVQTVFARLEQAEKDLAAWFDTYWHYNYRPSLQAMTEQLNVAGSDQAQQLAAISDAEQQNRALLERQRQEINSARAMSAATNDETCAVGTATGGVGRANVFSRAMRRAWQQESTQRALNTAGTPAAGGVGAMIASHAEEFENLFCDPRDNGGRNTCGESDPRFYNADTQVTARLFTRLTIPMDEDDRHATAVSHMLDNLTGRARAEVMSPSSLQAAEGIENWMLRRHYIARKNAVRSVPELVASWRVPGAGNGEFITALREGAGVSLDSMSDNPSYREIIHAMTIDRFNSGTYAIDKIGSAERQQMEKLVLSAMYLMQLRDYYELMERTALTLAVQVAVMSDQVNLPEGGAR